MTIQGRNKQLSVGSKTSSFRATRSHQKSIYPCPQPVNLNRSVVLPRWGRQLQLEMLHARWRTEDQFLRLMSGTATAGTQHSRRKEALPQTQNTSLFMRISSSLQMGLPQLPLHTGKEAKLWLWTVGGLEKTPGWPNCTVLEFTLWY